MINVKGQSRIINVRMLPFIMVAAGCFPGRVMGQAVPALPPDPGVRVGGPIPPRDPRLPTPPVTETLIPPIVTIPAPPQPTREVPNRPLTADEASRIALRMQPTISIARAALRAQRGRTTQVRSALHPILTVGAGYNYVTSITRAGNSGDRISSTGNSSGTGSASGGTGSGTTTSTGSTSGGTTGTGTTAGTGTTSGGTTGSGTTGGGTTTTGSGGSTSGSGGTTGTGTGGTTGTAASTGGTSTSGTPSTVGGMSIGIVATATLRQLLYDFNHTRYLVRQSATLESAANANISRVQHDTVFQVKHAFYQYVLDSRVVQVNEQEVANRQTQLDLTTARYNIGLGLLSDLVTAQTAKAEAITNLTLARQVTEQSRINLALLMGIDARTPFTPADTGEPAPASIDVNALTSRALQQRPEILQAQATVEAFQFGVRAARTSNAPAITGNIEVAATGNQFLPQNSGALLGIGLVWTPLDGGLSRGLQEEQRANVQAAQAQLIANRLSVTSDVSSAYVGLITAGQRVTSAGADVANAEQSVRIATGRFTTGIGQFVDILNAQAFLLNARINLVSAEENVQQYRTTLQHATGDVIPVP